MLFSMGNGAGLGFCKKISPKDVWSNIQNLVIHFLLFLSFVYLVIIPRIRSHGIRCHYSPQVWENMLNMLDEMYFFQASKMQIQASQGEDCQHCYFCSLVFDAESVFFVKAKMCSFKTSEKKLKTAIPLSATVDGSEIPNNHLGCIKPCK